MSESKKPKPRRKDAPGDMPMSLLAESERILKMENMTHTSMCMHWYDMGCRLREVFREEAKYGSNAIEQLAEYLGYARDEGVQILHGIRLFAESFDRDFVVHQLRKPMADGQALRFGHFWCVREVDSIIKREQLLDLARKKCLSPESLAKIVHPNS